MKLRLAQAREPTREMNRPKPGTDTATTAISSTRHVLITAYIKLLDLLANEAIKLACKQQLQLVISGTHVLTPMEPIGLMC